MALVWSGFFALQLFLAPKQPAEAPKDKVAQVDEKAAGAVKDDPAPAADPKPRADLPEDPAQAVVRAAPAPAPAVPRQWLTLGSADPESGYSGLYIFDNHGAAVSEAAHTCPPGPEHGACVREVAQSDAGKPHADETEEDETPETQGESAPPAAKPGGGKGGQGKGRGR